MYWMLGIQQKNHTMVKATAEAPIEFRGSGSDGMFFRKITECKDGVALEITKKFSLKRFLFPLYVLLFLCVVGCFN